MGHMVIIEAAWLYIGPHQEVMWSDCGRGQTARVVRQEAILLQSRI